MATRKPPTETMGSRAAPPKADSPKKTDEPKKDEPKASDEKKSEKSVQIPKEAVRDICAALNGPGDMDHEKKFGDLFKAFQIVAKECGVDIEGFDVSIMDEDVSDSRAYGKRVASRKYWATKLAAL